MNLLNNLNMTPSEASIKLPTVLMNQLFPSLNISEDEETADEIQLIRNVEDELMIFIRSLHHHTCPN